MFIILASPIALYLTFLTLTFVVWGVNRRTVYYGLFALGLVLLLTAAGTAKVLGSEAQALPAGGSDQVRAQGYRAWVGVNAWIQALGWPLLLGGLFWFRRARLGAQEG